jgi:hypothetical protein
VASASSIFVWRAFIGEQIISLPNDSDQPRGPSENGVSAAGKSFEDGRLPALRCDDWFGRAESAVVHF